MSYSTVYDVIVCGGGTSGTAAAIAAARTGAKTLLVERTGVLGGQMSLSARRDLPMHGFSIPRGNETSGGLWRRHISGFTAADMHFPICAIPSGKRQAMDFPMWTRTGGWT